MATRYTSYCTKDTFLKGMGYISVFLFQLKPIEVEKKRRTYSYQNPITQPAIILPVNENIGQTNGWFREETHSLL